MSYPAQNTDTEFQALVQEIKDLHKFMNLYAYPDKVEESFDRLFSALGNRRCNELFNNDNTKYRSETFL